jgi:protein disulfide-isomerase
MIGFGRFSYCALAIVQISGAGAALAAAPDVAADQTKVDALVEVTTTVVPSGDSFSLTARASVSGPYKFNNDAPWKIELTRADGKTVSTGPVEFGYTEKVVLGKASLPSSTVAPAELKFKMTYYVCDTAQTWCKRSTREGNVVFNKTSLKDLPVTAKQTINATKPAKSSQSSTSDSPDVEIGGVSWKSLPAAVRDMESARAWVKQLDGAALVYWGAQWCPPCNELKAQVFSNPGFAEATSGVQRIAIDGDAPSAQTVSEVLGVSGYPTILILGAKGVELARINESVTFEEFKETVAAALAQQKPTGLRIKQALAGEASADDWRVLGQTRWEFDRMGLAKSPVEDAQLLVNLYRAAPKTEPALRAQFIFAAADPAEKANDSKLSETIAKELAVIVDQSAALASLAVALRSHLIYGYETGSKVLASLSKAERETAEQNWFKALAHIEKAPADKISADDKLWLVYPRILAEKAALKLSNGEKAAPANPEKSISAELRKETAARARDVFAKKASPHSTYERKAMVTGAADLLAMVGEFDQAESALLSELKTADKSWHMYLYSALASLESDRNNPQKALEYSALASKSAVGNASRFQWATSDLLRSLKQKRPADQVVPVLENAYKVLFEIPDAFRGRNAARVQAIENAMTSAEVLKNQAVQDVITRYQLKCASLESDVKTRCLTHFASLIKIDFAAKNKPTNE